MLFSKPQQDGGDTVANSVLDHQCSVCRGSSRPSALLCLDHWEAFQSRGGERDEDGDEDGDRGGHGDGDMDGDGDGM